MTGVQTCALPILASKKVVNSAEDRADGRLLDRKSVVEGKSVPGSGDGGGGRLN